MWKVVYYVEEVDNEKCPNCDAILLRSGDADEGPVFEPCNECMAQTVLSAEAGTEFDDAGFPSLGVYAVEFDDDGDVTQSHTLRSFAVESAVADILDSVVGLAEEGEYTETSRLGYASDVIAAVMGTRMPTQEAPVDSDDQ